MKKFLLSLMALFAVTMAATAGEVTITQDGSFAWTAGTDATYGQGFSATAEGFNLGLWKHNSANAIVEPANEIRVYKNAAFIIENVAGEAITKVVMTTTEKKYTNSMTANGETDAAVGDGNAKTVTWTGSTNKLILEANNSQVRVKTIVITYGEAEPETQVAKPVLSLSSGTYYGPIEVACTTATEGATIMYSKDGGETYHKYELPIAIGTSCELEVYATKEGLEDSEHVTAEYTITEPTSVNSVAEANAEAANGTVVKFANPVTCVYQNGSYTYVQDESGATLLYGSGLPTYENGSVIPAGFFGKMTTFKGLIEFTTEIIKNYYYTSASFAESTETVDPVQPAVVAVADVTADMMNKYVVFQNVTYDAANKKLVDGNNTLTVFNRFSGVSLPTADATYDVVGFVSIYSDAIQIYPIEFAPAGSTAVEGIKAAAQEDGQVYNLLGQPVSADTKDQILVKNGKKFINK